MNLEDIKIDENIFKRLNPFRNKSKFKNPIGFDKMKEISDLKKRLQGHLKAYINNFNKAPDRKDEFMEALGEALLNELSLTIGKVQQVLTQEHDKLNEEIKDNSILRNINSLFNNLMYIKQDTPLVEVEDILLHIYKKLKEHLDIKFPLDAEYDDIDPDSEQLAHNTYEEKFFKNPSTNFNDFANIDVANTNDDKYNEVKEKYRANFNKIWETKYKNEVSSGNENYAVIQAINKEWYKKPINDTTSYQDFKNKRVYETYFELWFNTILQSKFNKLWDKDFKKRWVELHKKEREQSKSRLTHLKENFNNIFKG